MCGWFGQMNTEKQRMISAGSEAVSLYRKDCPIFEYLSVIYNEIIAPPTFLSLRGCRIPMMASIDTEIPLAQHHGLPTFSQRGVLAYKSRLPMPPRRSASHEPAISVAVNINLILAK